MDKEEVIRTIRGLEARYNYWFEVFRRSTNKSEKENAKKKYQDAIEENIRLQKEYNLRIPPQYSSSYRKEMQIDEENGTLLLSEKQLREQTIVEDFDRGKKALEETITKNLKEHTSDYIKDVLDKISSAGLSTEKRIIMGHLDDVGFFKPNGALSMDAKVELLLPFFVISFAKFFSGEAFVEDLYEAFHEAVENYKTQQIKKAEELFEGCMSMLGRAAEFSTLRIGKSYFELRTERLKSEWQLATKGISGKAEHERKQHEIKDKVLGPIADSPGILQTEIYRLMNNYRKEEIGEALYFLEKEKRISREKKGSTYRLFKVA